MEFELDLSHLIELLKETPEAIYTGGKRGLHDAMDDWLKESRDVAPLEYGNLRKQMHTEVDEGKLTGTIYGNAVESSPKYGRFNYGYWLHEVHTGNLSTPGTVHKFLEAPAVLHKDKWMKHIEGELAKAAKRKGW